MGQDITLQNLMGWNPIGPNGMRPPAPGAAPILVAPVAKEVLRKGEAVGPQRVPSP